MLLNFNLVPLGKPHEDRRNVTLRYGNTLIESMHRCSVNYVAQSIDIYIYSFSKGCRK